MCVQRNVLNYTSGNKQQSLPTQQRIYRYYHNSSLYSLHCCWKAYSGPQPTCWTCASQGIVMLLLVSLQRTDPHTTRRHQSYCKHNTITDAINNPSTTTLLHPFNGLFSRTTWVSWHQKGRPFWVLMKQENWAAVASAAPYANHLHLAPYK